MAVLFGMSFVSNTRRNMLFYSILQSLGSAFYVTRITLARKLININSHKLIYNENANEMGGKEAKEVGRENKNEIGRENKLEIGRGNAQEIGRENKTEIG